MKTATTHILLLLIIGISQGLATNQFSSSSMANAITGISPNIVIIVCVILMTCIWLGCTYFMASRHQKTVQYLQSQLDELWLLQAKPSVWPHAPFIPNPRGENPPEYIPPRNSEEQEQEEKEAMERTRMAMAFLAARNKDKLAKSNDSDTTEF
ncbi:hypothetical protein KR054_002267 [Drosophila jambulina]|nr:hypothetical protein KR054_002267 [Drosophila jambulina]